VSAATFNSNIASNKYQSSTKDGTNKTSHTETEQSPQSEAGLDSNLFRKMMEHKFFS
jgi:hypothetical protein